MKKAKITKTKKKKGKKISVRKTQIKTQKK
jgi:hypothetical protein